MWEKETVNRLFLPHPYSINKYPMENNLSITALQTFALSCCYHHDSV